MNREESKSIALDSLRACLFGAIISLVLSIVLSVLIKYVNIGDKLIDGLNITFKALSIVLGLMIGVKSPSKGIIKGLIAGIIYVAVTLIVYFLVRGGMYFDMRMALDVITSLLFAVIGGIIAVNIKSK